jgi:leucyl aminopeptidase
LRVEVADKPLSEVDADLLAVLVFDGDDLPEPLAHAPGSEDVKSAYRRATLVHPGTPRRALVVGLGERGDFTPERARVAAAVAARTAGSMESTSLALRGPDGDDPAGTAAAMVEGAILASYRFDRFKSKGDEEDGDSKALEEITVIGGSELSKSVEAARIGAEAENFARELQDLPANVVTPSYLSGRAEAIAEEHSTVSVDVLGREEIKEKGMGGLTAVSQGSAEEPQLIVLRYSGGGDETLGLVGKGVTFDSGGISIKPAGGMQEMKMDMSGAAAVLETVSALAKLDVPIDVLAVIPSSQATSSPSSTARRWRSTTPTPRAA